MKLKRLHIKTQYGILNNFVLEFPVEPKNNISVFIGENGSGKTTVLEAITRIFSWFINEDEPEFEFELEYAIRLSETIDETTTSGEVKVDYIDIKLFSSGGNVDVEAITADGILKGMKEVNGSRYLSQIKQTIRDNKYKLLPDSIAIYYAGESTNIKNIVDQHNEVYRKALRELKEDIDPRLFFYYEPYHFNLLLLGLLSFEYSTVPEILSDKINIYSLYDFTITLKEPDWKKSRLDPKKGEFWGADGAVLVFLKQLFSLASYNEITDKTLVLHFDEANNSLHYKLKELYGTERGLFNILETIWQNGLIKSVDINFYKIPETELITLNFSQLSEGEKQAIIILGLNELVLKENSLALYDEPDTYLHPKWQRDLIPELENYSVSSENVENSYIVTSHSPNIVSGTKKENLFVFKDGIIKDIPFDSYGKNVEAVLIDFFNVEGTRNKHVEELIYEVQSLVNQRQFKSPQFKTKFIELKNILGQTAPEITEINLEISKHEKA